MNKFLDDESRSPSPALNDSMNPRSIETIPMAQPHLDNLLEQKLQLFEQIKSRFGEPTEKANESFAAREVLSRE